MWGGALDGRDGALVIQSDDQLTGSIVNSGTITGGIIIEGTQQATSDAIHVTSTGRLGNEETDVIVQVDGTLSSTNGDAIKIEGDATGQIEVNSDISNGAVNIAAGGDFTGTIDVTNGGAIDDGIVISGTQTASGDGIRLATGGTIGSDPAGNAIMIHSTGSLSSTVINGKAINIDGGTLTGTIHNAGDITGDIVIDGTQTASGSAYHAEGTSTDRATLSGDYIVTAGNTVTSTSNTIYTGQYADTEKVVIETGATLQTTGNQTSAVYVAVNGHLGGDDVNAPAIRVEGTLQSSNGAGITIDGAANGVLLVKNSGVITGQGGQTDAAIVLNGTYTGSFDNQGRIGGGIYLDGTQTASDEAYRATGSPSGSAILTGGYIVDTGGSVTSTNSDAVKINSKGYVDAIVVNGVLRTTDADDADAGNDHSAIYIAQGGQLGGSFSEGTVTSNRQENDLVIEVGGSLSSINGSAIRVDGAATGELFIQSGATVSGDSSEGAIAINGRYTGTFDSKGTVTGGVIISGLHEASNGLYQSSGTASLTGSYTIVDGGFARTQNGHGVAIDGNSTMDKVTVSEGGSLITEDSDGSAVYVGTNANLTGLSGDIILVEGTLSGVNGYGVGIDGNVSGDIKVGTEGTLSGGKGSVLIGGTYTGTVDNQGTISGAVTVKAGGLATASTDHTVHTKDGATTSGVAVKSTGTLRNTGNFSAVYVASGGTLGSSESDIAVDVDGVLLASGAAAVKVDSGATATGIMRVGSTGSITGNAQGSISIAGIYTGSIVNHGDINDGIFITGSHTSATEAYISQGTSSDNAVLTDGFNIGAGRTVTSSGANTVFVGEHSTIDVINVDGTLRSTGTNRAAVYVADNGQIGTIDNDGTLSSTSGAAVVIDGRLTNTINNQGVIDGDIVFGGSFSGSGNAYYSTGSSNRLDGVFRVADGGSVSSSSSHTVLIDTGSSADAVVVDAGGTLGNSGANSGLFVRGTLGDSSSNSAIVVNGTLSSTSGTAINIDSSGNLVGRIIIGETGTVSGSTSAITISGDHDNMIENRGTITDDVLINSNQSSSGPAYYTWATTSTDPAELNGVYQISGSSTVTSTGNHTLYLGANGSIDQVDIDSGSTLSSSASGGSAIYVAAGGELGDLANAAAVNVDGTLSASSGNAIRVDGTLTGTVNNSSTIQGGIVIAGSHVASTSAYFSSGGDLDAYTVRAGATSGSTGNHAIYIGNTANVDVITVDGTSLDTADRGILASTDSDSSAVLVDTGGTLGTAENMNALVVNGQVSSSEGHAIDINGTTLGKIMIGEFGLIAGGTGTDKAIVVDGTLTGTIENQGVIQDGIVITNTGTQVTSGRLYSAAGNDDNQASLTGGFTSQSGNVHSTGDHAIYIGDDAITDQVMVDSGAALGSTAADRSGILVASGGQLGVSETDTAVLLRGSLYSTQGNAIQIDGTATGKILLEQVGPVSGGAITGLAADASAVAINGTYVGMIENHFDIDGGIEVSGLHSSSNEAYKAVGTSTRDAELTGSYTIKSGGQIQSTGADTLYLGADSYTDTVVIEADGSLLTTGASKSAIHVAADGLLGPSASGDAIDLRGVISSSQGEAINIAGIVSGRIRNAGDINGGIKISGTHTASVATYYSEGTATVVDDVTTIDYASLNGGYTVANNGLAGSTGDHTVSVGQYGFIDQVTVETGGVIGNTASGKSGVFVAENGLLGSSAGSDSIQVSGTLSSNSGAAVGVDGQIQGTIRNTSGDINGDISVSGSHVASNAVYYAEGTDTKTASLAGAYRVAANGVAGSTADHSVYTAAYGQTNEVVVENQGSLTSEGAGKSAIYVASLGQLGDLETSTAVEIDGTLSSTSAPAINIEGTGLGRLLVGSTGSISGASGSPAIDMGGQYTGTFENRGGIAGIVVSGNHSAANQAYFSQGLSSNLAELTGGYRVNGGGVTSSSNNHAVHLGDYSIIDFIEVSGSEGSQASSVISGASGMSGIYVGENAQLGGFNSRGPSDAAILISNNGVVGSATGSAIKVDGSVVGKILVDNAVLGNSTSSIALDFSGADTDLNYEQIGSGSTTRGSIIGSAINTNDTVTIRQGLFTGGTIRDVDNLIISDDARFTMTDDFTLPARTMVELEQDFNSGENAGQAIITTQGELSALADGSTIYIQPESIEAYQALYNGGTITLVDAVSIEAGTADRVVLGSTPIVDAKAQYSNGDLVVVLAAKSSVDIGGVLGQALDAALNPNSGEDERVQEIVDVLNKPNDEVAEIGKQVKPDTTGHQQQVSRDLTLSSQNIIFDRTSTLRTGFNSGDSLIRFGGGGLWGQMVYIDGNQDQREQEAGYNNRLGGVLLGLDAEFSDRLKLGVAATYGFGVVNTEDNRSTESNNFLGTLYSSWEYKRYFLDSMLSMGGARNTYNQSLTTLNSQTSSEYDSTQWNLRFVTGARLPFGRSWEFTPMAELNYGKVSFDSYIEKGEHGFVKEVKFDDYSALELGLGFTLNGTMKSGKARIRPDVTFMAHQGPEYQWRRGSLHLPCWR